MNCNAGLWIDHKEAIIVFAATDAAAAEETKRMESGMEKHVRYSGHSASDGSAEDQRECAADHTFRCCIRFAQSRQHQCCACCYGTCNAYKNESAPRPHMVRPPVFFAQF